MTQKGVKLADVQNVLALLRTLGEAYRLFCQYVNQTKAKLSSDIDAKKQYRCFLRYQKDNTALDGCLLRLEDHTLKWLIT